MSILIPVVRESRIWNGTFHASTVQEAASTLIECYNQSTQANADKMKATFTYELNDDVEVQASVAIRHNYRGLYSADLKNKGVAELNTDKGPKKKYHIKVTVNETSDAYLLAVSLLKVLRISNRITHGQICINKKDTKEKTTLSIDFKNDHSFSEISLRKA